MTVVNAIHSKEKRRILRKNQTPEEEILWQMLRGNKTGFKWRRQVSVGAYVADFYCYSEKLAIELDGSQHLEKDAVEYDKIRDEFFKNWGIRTIRISNTEINQSVEVVYQKIISSLKNPSPKPSPR